MEITSRQGEAVSVAVDRTVRAGKEKEFDEYINGIIEASSNFSGYLGTELIKTGEKNRYLVIFRYSTQEQMEVWKSSEERAFWVAKIDQVIEEPAKLTVLTGLESWFVLSDKREMVPPPKHKMAIVVYAAIVPTLMVFQLLAGEMFDSIPQYYRFFVTSLFVVLMMTYFSMPLMTKLFKSFLYK